MMWDLAKSLHSGEGAPNLDDDAGAFFPAFHSDRLIAYYADAFQRQEVAGRGYATHTWTVNAQCIPVDIQRREFEHQGRRLFIPVPMFADYLDAMRCESPDDDAVTTAIREATNPDVNYPYPIDEEPICD